MTLPLGRAERLVCWGTDRMPRRKEPSTSCRLLRCRTAASPTAASPAQHSTGPPVSPPQRLRSLPLIGTDTLFPMATGQGRGERGQMNHFLHIGMCSKT